MTAAPNPTLAGPGFRTTPVWFGPVARPLLGWSTSPAAGAAAGAALVLPAIGYEYTTTHRTLRTLAETLAASGWTALRIDYDATGDSAGHQWDADRVGAWRASVKAGADELRRRGHTEIVVIGLRLGATLALLEGADIGAERIVAWAPVVSGRRYVRELRMLGLTVEPSNMRPDPDGAIAFGGTVFDAETLTDLSAIDVQKLDTRPAASVLLIERPDRPALSALADRLTEVGSQVETRAIDGSQHCLDEPTEYATVPDDIVRAIASWVSDGSRTEAAPSSSPAPAEAEFSWDGIQITESVATFTAHEQIGIVGRPVGAARATVVWANPGSETHIGPGRAWVEYSRALNLRGFRTIRLDCRGWGESPDDGLAPARPYDAHMADDLRAVVADLEARGWGPVVLAGLCAGAWMALDVARTTPLGGVIACNPQLYWQPGDIVEANIITETHIRREAERARIKQLNRYGLWWLLDILGLRIPAARCLDDVDARRTPTLLLFSPADDGLEFLEDRLGRALTRWRARGIEVVELENIDHGMHRAWWRGEVIDAILTFLERF